VTTCVNATEDTSVKFDINDPDYMLLSDSGRWVEVTLPTSKKGHYLTVANYYGIAGASQGGEDFRCNEWFLAAAGRRAASFHNHPYFLIGDCNDSITHSKVMAALTEQHILYDVAAEFTKKDNPCKIHSPERALQKA